MEHINSFLSWTAGVLGKFSLSPYGVRLGATLIAVGAVLLLAVAAHLLLTRVVAPLVQKFVAKTAITWDDELLNPRVVASLSELALSMLLLVFLPDAFCFFPKWKGVVVPVLQVSVVLFAAGFVNRLILAVYKVICDETHLPAQSLKGLRQMVQLVFFVVAGIVVVSILINKSPVIILSGLGASAAVLMLVFKDTLLGLVAGVQLTANDMLKPGDWITAPKYGINGIVLDVNLATVKVQNFDMTIITVPPYLLVSEAFQNWKGMKQSPGRRVQRSLCIDAHSVRFATGEEKSRFGAEKWGKHLDMGQEWVNLSLFRRWLEYHIAHQPGTSTGMTTMVRELQPLPEGIPVEIYFFTTRQEWVAYEHTQADLLDYVVATLPKFGLRLFQAPSGHDIRSLGKV